MADNILKEKRKQFVRSVGIGAINGLLDELLQKKVLNQEEMEKIKCTNPTVSEKARDLCDSVIRKGPQACQICIAYICEEDPTWQKLWDCLQSEDDISGGLLSLLKVVSGE